MSLTIPAGQCVLLTGPSGCGKTTLLRLLNGLIPSYYRGTAEGIIRIDGRDGSGWPIEERAGEIGTVFQDPRAQFFNVDTTSELAFGPENAGLPEAEILRRISETVRDLHIEPLMDRSLFELSGGEKQEIACASVDTLQPKIILLDEPSANLDCESSGNLRRILLAWKKSGKTILISEHRINYVWDLVDRAILLGNGVIRKDMSREEISAFRDCLPSFDDYRSRSDRCDREWDDSCGRNACGTAGFLRTVPEYVEGAYVCKGFR
ncbi:MAG: ABC transporter ATP-binding protein [Bulleidia sp.]